MRSEDKSGSWEVGKSESWKVGKSEGRKVGKEIDGLKLANA